MTPLSLNAGQRECIEKFIHSNRNLFISGPGGTGKSEVLKQIRQMIDEDKVAVLAPTGIAAQVISGKTWHSYFGVAIMEGGLARSRDRSLGNPMRREAFRNINTIILDEVSFIREEELRLMNWILQSARESNQPMGGVRVIAFGDFYQLPPVRKPFESIRPHFAFQESSSKWSPHHFHVWHDLNFCQINLTENMRTVDYEFAQLLRLIRDGIQIPDNLRQIIYGCQSRYQASPDSTKDYLQIFSTNEEVERHNLSRLSEINQPELKFKAEFTGNPDYFAFTPLPDSLNLKVGARVLVRQNNYAEGVMNGEFGFATDLDADRIRVRTDRGQIIDLTKKEFAVLDSDYRRQATVLQFPVSLGYAITVHKSQGQTISSPVVIDLANHWEPGQSYVALSRVRSRDQVFIKGEVDFEALNCRDPNVVRFYRGEYSRPEVKTPADEQFKRAQRFRDDARTRVRTTKSVTRKGV